MIFEEQVQNVVEAIESSGWQVEVESKDITQMPVDMVAVKEEQSIPIRLYTWAIVKSGRRGERKINWRYLPFRIRHRGVGDTLRTELKKDAYNLLIGQSEEYGHTLFALFDPFVHREHIESSPIQIKLETLRQAEREGFSYQFKNTGDTTLVFYPESLMQMLLGLYKLVFEGKQKEDVADIISKIMQSTDPVEPEDVFPTLGKRERTMALRAIRDPSFRNRVMRAYENKCALCGLDLDFVSAAHIVSVGQGGSDETKNGVALCPNHHEAFDLGLIGFDEDYSTIVNKRQLDILIKKGKKESVRVFLTTVRENLILPRITSKRPSSQYVQKALKDRGLVDYVSIEELDIDDL